MALIRKTAAEYDTALEQLSLTGSGFDLVKAEWISGTHFNSRRPLWTDIESELKRLSTLDMTQSEVTNGEKLSSIIRVYGDCIDSLSSFPTITLSHPVQVILTARHWFPTATGPLKVTLPLDSSIAFRTSTLPPGFTIILNGVRKTLTIQPGKWGVIVAVDESGVHTTPTSPPGDELDTFDYWAELTPEGQAKPGIPRRNDNLPRLLQYQFILATTWIQSDLATTASILAFISGATNGNSAALELSLQANALAARLHTMNSGFAIYVPTLDLSTTRSVLKARLASAVAFEDSYRKLATEGARKEDVKGAAELALGHSGDVESKYAFLADVQKRRFSDAKKSYGVAKERFNKLQSELDELAREFNKGLEQWKKEQKLKMIGEAVLALVTVTASVVTTVVAPPVGASGAAAGAATAAASIKNIAEGASQFKKILEGIKKIAELLEKLQKAVENIKTVVESTATIVKVITDNVGAAPNLPKVPSNNDNDAINVAAEWDSYAIDVKMVFDPLAMHNISGCEAYYSALQKLPILGKAILATQTAFVDTGDAFTRVILQQHVAGRNSARLKGAINNIITDKKVLAIVERAMFERLLLARTWVAVDFHGYLAAYTYYSLNRTPPIKISAAKPASYYVEDAARLQEAIALARSSLQSQERDFTFKSETSPTIFGSDWLTGLKKFRELSLTINYADPVFAKFCRVRVSRARCYIRGATTDTTLDVRIQASPRFRDIDLAEPHKAVEFVGEGSTRHFEYHLNSEKIVTDGSYVEVYSRPALFTTWTITVEDEAVKLDGVTSMELQFLCEVCRR